MDQTWLRWWLIAPTATSHYLNLCWLQNNDGWCHSHENNFTASARANTSVRWVLKVYFWDYYQSDQPSASGLFLAQSLIVNWSALAHDCPACRTTLIATRFRVAVICPIILVPHCIRVFFYFVWFVFINHIFQFYYELCTYCNIFGYLPIIKF